MSIDLSHPSIQDAVVHLNSLNQKAIHISNLQGQKLDRQAKILMKVDQVLKKEGRFFLYQQTYQGEDAPLSQYAVEIESKAEAELKYSAAARPRHFTFTTLALQTDRQLLEMTTICTNPNCQADQLKREIEEVKKIAQHRLSIVGHEVLNDLTPLPQLSFEILEKLTILKQQSTAPSDEVQQLFKETEDLCKVSEYQANLGIQKCQTQLRYAANGGKLQPLNSPTNLFEALQNFVKVMTLKDDEVKLQHEIDPALEGMMLMMDYPILSGIFENLIRNSKRAVEKRQIKVITFITKVEEIKDDFCKVYFAVKDTGTGFDGKNFIKKTYKQIFKETAHPPRILGHGIGLGECAEIVSTLGSTLLITSNTNEGSLIEFTLSIKRVLSHMPQLPSLLPPSSSRESDSMLSPVSAVRSIQGNPNAPIPMFKVLLVEDHTMQGRLTQKKLTTFNVECDWKQTGEAAVEACKKQEYDFILMDFDLGRNSINGKEACKQIKEWLKTRGKTNKANLIWGLTASLESEQKAGEEAGMDCVLAKPIKDNTLVCTVEAFKASFPDCPLVQTSPLQATPRRLSPESPLSLNRTLSTGSTGSAGSPRTTTQRELPGSPVFRTRVLSAGSTLAETPGTLTASSPIPGQRTLPTSSDTVTTTADSITIHLDRTDLQKDSTAESQ